jgi:hypothetical protein
MMNDWFSRIFKRKELWVLLLLLISCVLPFTLLFTFVLGGMFRQGFGEMRWVYYLACIGIFVFIAWKQQSEKKKGLVFILRMLCAGFIASLLMYTLLALPSLLDGTTKKGLSDTIMRILIFPVHLAIAVCGGLSGGLIILLSRFVGK